MPHSSRPYQTQYHKWAEKFWQYVLLIQLPKNSRSICKILKVTEQEKLRMNQSLMLIYYITKNYNSCEYALVWNISSINSKSINPFVCIWLIFPIKIWIDITESHLQPSYLNMQYMILFFLDEFQLASVHYITNSYSALRIRNFKGVFVPCISPISIMHIPSTPT